MSRGIYVRTEETKKGLRTLFKGKSHTAETRRKMKKAHQGIRNYLYGKHLPGKTKEKIRLAHIGQHPSDETKLKMKESHLGLFAGNKHPNWGKRGGHHSERTRRKMSEKRKQLYEKGLLPCYAGRLNPNWENGEKIQGENNPKWKGGIYALERAKDMRQAKYKHWRRKVLERDNFTCIICEKVGGRLNAHHIESWIDYPEKRYDVDNGITLCEDCHKDVHRDEIDCLQYLEVK